ncbi:MAG: hypothetical protein WD232_09220, partial [Acidimicrobiales bacterium]
LATTSRQLDLEVVDVDPALTLYRNTAWAPVTAVVPESIADAFSRDGAIFETVAPLDLSGAPAALYETRHLHREGVVPAGTVYLSGAAADGWQLRVDGEVAPRSEALGWANTFEVAEGGDGTLRYRTDPLHQLALVVQVALWAALVFGVVRTRRRLAS